MKLAVGLPTYVGDPIDPSNLLNWARLADRAGFEAVGVHDKPNHRARDPLATLAAVATITSHMRLATTILILPARQEALAGEPAAVIDQLSEGKLDLGVCLFPTIPAIEQLEGLAADVLPRFGPPSTSAAR